LDTDKATLGVLQTQAKASAKLQPEVGSRKIINYFGRVFFDGLG
jgi:hypothetical protein